MAKAIGNFSPADQNELEFFTFDFVNDLTPGDSIPASPLPVWTCTVSKGDDPDAATRLSGAPSVFGTKVTQKAGGFLPGVQYVMACLVTTALGQKVNLWTFLCGEVVGC